MLRLTGFRTFAEYYRETNEYQRALIERSIEAWHDERDGSGGSASMPGL